MTAVFAALVIAAAVVWATAQMMAELKRMRAEAARARVLQIFTTFAQPAATTASDPRPLLEWEPLARTARKLFPEEFEIIDRAGGDTFPFGTGRVQSAHASWTAEWLEWERSHDAAYKLKEAELEQELARSGASAILRARLDAVEREKLALYQRKYEEYIRVGKAFKALELDR